jgi:hypothetical protein
MENVFGGAAVLCIYLGPLLLALAVGGFISDVLLPRCPFLLRLLERLTGVDLGGNDYEDD